MKQLLLTAFLAFLSLTSFSTTAQAADYEVEICALQAHNVTSTVYLQVCGGWTSKSNCPADGFIAWDASTFQGETMYSTALTAFSLGKTVSVRLTPNSCLRYDHTNMIRILKERSDNLSN